MTHSPYKYISTNEAGHRVVRTDLILLDGLSHCINPVSTEALIEISDPRNQAQINWKHAIFLLTTMIADGFVERTDGLNEKDLRWQITEKGRAHLIAAETQRIVDDCARHTPVRRQQRSEPAPLDLNARLRASHAQLDADGVAPAGKVTITEADEANEIAPRESATALLCVDEDELDGWWDELDVECKADAFAQWSLNNSSSHIHTGEPKIPLLGTIGDDAPHKLPNFMGIAGGAQ